MSGRGDTAGQGLPVHSGIQVTVEDTDFEILKAWLHLSLLLQSEKDHKATLNFDPSTCKMGLINPYFIIIVRMK